MYGGGGRLELSNIQAALCPSLLHSQVLDLENFRKYRVSNPGMLVERDGRTLCAIPRPFYDS